MQGAVDFHDHSLLEARYVDAELEEPCVDYLSALYASKLPDLIITVGAPAASFVQRHRPRLFPGVPLLSMGTEVSAIVGFQNSRVGGFVGYR